MHPTGNLEKYRPRLKIISGGQTGADRGGLDAAIALGIPHGGYCPRRRKAEDGRIPDRYQLSELASASYLTRTEKNVKESDCTLLFTVGPPTGGSKRTIDFANKHRKPIFMFDLAEAIEESADSFKNWFTLMLKSEKDIIVINVAGSRESKSHGIATTTEHSICKIILNLVN